MQGPRGVLFDHSERIAYLAVGSNIEPSRHVRACLELLRGSPGLDFVRASSLYRTRPWGGATDAEFINLVVAVRTRLAGLELLSLAQSIEQRLGRLRACRYGARTMDIDLLLIGDEQHQEESLVVPHPGLLERDFMLMPLLEIAADARYPVTGEFLSVYRDRLRYRQIIERLETDGMSP